MDDKYETVKLSYTIHKYSSYSATYVPENIMVNNPADQLSRWFTDSTTSSQYIMLKLGSPSIVETIKFGKYIKAHVSDLKKFQVLGGMDENNLSLLLSAGLKKDSAAESFRLRHRTVEGLYLPVQYIKIVPLQSWGPAYNYTIWYIELQGKNQEELMNSIMNTFELRTEQEAVRLILKHLQRRPYKDAFEALSRESGVTLEGPLQARLWTALVEKGDYDLTEDILKEALADGEFEWYMSWQPLKPEWQQLSSCSPEVEAWLCAGDVGPPSPNALSYEPSVRSYERICDLDPRLDGAESKDELTEESLYAASSQVKPGPRGGHQLVVDPITGTLYLFGGWNGARDLDDLWQYEARAGRWALLSARSGAAGGPSPRSCHKMVLDPRRRRLYTLGRYLDNAQRVPTKMNSELYMYELETRTWSLVCEDTAAVGGPRLVFDHQMCIDADTHTIYVFGGRVLPANTEEAASPQYSGLYAYYTATNTWEQLLADKHDRVAPQPRVSHSMLFHPGQRRLYIFAGQRNKEHLVDLWWWDVRTHECGALCASAAPPPAAGFTQRATIDPDTDEIFVLSGMSKEKDKRVYNTLWVLSLRHMTWSLVYRNDRPAADEPRPRFAHQLVYDPVNKVHYLFGGNPGAAWCPRLRLDDLWALRLARAGAERAWAGARRAVRHARFRELCRRQPPRALLYLRTAVRAAVDHTDHHQVKQFHQLATELFSGGAEGPGGGGATGARGARPLSARRVRALARRRGAAPAPADLAAALAAVLGASDTVPEPRAPYEEAEAAESAPDTWDVADGAEPAAGAAEDDAEAEAWAARGARVALYDELCRYFRPSAVPPRADLTDLVTL